MIRILSITGLIILGLVLEQKPALAPKATQLQSSKVNIAVPSPNATTGTATQSAPRRDGEEQIVKVTIETSRPEVTTGGGYGIYADLQNLESVPVTLYPRETVMVVQPELADDHTCIFELDGFFPTEANPTKDHPLGGPILIPPKEHYRAFWDISGEATSSCEEDPKRSAWPEWMRKFASSLKDRISFVPGDYSFVVVGKGYLSPDGKAQADYHTFTQAARLHVSITQFSAILAAMIGGLIAYFVTGLRGGGEFARLKQEQEEGKRRPLNRWGVILRNLFSAALLSAVVTVILSRISDTQFPIKVSVSDFWGALVVGFVAYFTGNRLIDRIVGLAPKSSGTAPPNQAGGDRNVPVPQEHVPQPGPNS